MSSGTSAYGTLGRACRVHLIDRAGSVGLVHSEFRRTRAPRDFHLAGRIGDGATFCPNVA
jgi:hypothetical protein